MYTYEEFKTVLLESVKEAVGSNKEVEFIEVQKNNQNKKEGITIKESGVNVTPVIYLWELYENYVGNGDLEWCKEQVLLAEAEKNLIDPKEIIKSWEEAKKNIEPYLLKRDWNKDVLRNLPHKEFLDFIVCFRLMIGKTEGHTISMKITNDILQIWEISVEDLWEATVEYLNNQKFTIKDMDLVMAEMLGIELKEEDCSGKQYILSSEDGINGSIGLLRVDLFQDFYNKVKQDFFILPSSCHELILLKKEQEMNIECLKNIVREVNETQVAKEERLSDQIYAYSNGKIQMADTI